MAIRIIDSSTIYIQQVNQSIVSCLLFYFFLQTDLFQSLGVFPPFSTITTVDVILVYEDVWVDSKGEILGGGGGVFGTRRCMMNVCG